MQWYDYISEENPNLLGCPLLELTELYNFVDIETIINIVYIIFYLNKLMNIL